MSPSKRERPCQVDAGAQKILYSKLAPEWRNWYTHQTQNLAGFTSHVGSSPTSGIIDKAFLGGKPFFISGHKNALQQSSLQEFLLRGVKSPLGDLKGGLPGVDQIARHRVEFPDPLSIARVGRLKPPALNPHYPQYLKNPNRSLYKSVLFA
jgi:hypothetical protein